MFKTLGRWLIGVAALSVALAAAGTGVASADQGQAAGTRMVGGGIVAVADGSLTLELRRGRSLEVLVDAESAIHHWDGRRLDLQDLQPGERVLAEVERRGEMELYAVRVLVFPPRTEYRGAGVVSAVGRAEFEFVGRQGRLWQFTVDADTVITDRSGVPLSLADVQKGTRLLVAAELRADGKWWAKTVKIGRAPANP